MAYIVENNNLNSLGGQVNSGLIPPYSAIAEFCAERKNGLGIHYPELDVVPPVGQYELTEHMNNYSSFFEVTSFSAEWLDYATLVSENVGYKTSDVSADESALSQIEFAKLLAYVHYRTGDISRNPASDIAEWQKTEFDHVLRTAKVVGMEFGLDNTAILSALTHSLIDSDPQSDEADYLSLANIFGPERQEIPKNLLIQDKIMDLIEAVGEIIHIHPALAEKENPVRATNALEESLVAINELQGIGYTRATGPYLEDISGGISLLRSIIAHRYQTYDRISEAELIPKEFISTSISDAATEIFFLSQLFIGNDQLSRTALMVMTANSIDNLRNPLAQKSADQGMPNNYKIAYPHRFTPESNGISRRIEDDLIEAELFYIPCLEGLSQTALKPLLELVTAWRNPQEFRNLRIALDQVSAEHNSDYFDSRMREVSVAVLSSTQRILESGELGEGFTVVDYKTFRTRYKEYLAECTSRDTCIDNAHIPLGANEAVIMPQRVKSPASMLKKMLEDADYYDKMLREQGFTGERLSVEWYKEAVHLVNDVYASTVIFGNNEPSNGNGNFRQDQERVRRLATALSDSLANDPYLVPFKGVLPNKYRNNSGDPLGNDPERAIRVKDRTGLDEDGNAQDGYYNISLGFLLLDRYGLGIPPVGIDLHVTPFDKYMIADIDLPAHLIYKLKESGLITNSSEKHVSAVLRALAASGA